MTDRPYRVAQGIPSQRLRNGMLLRATLAQNVGTGCAFGGLGVSVLTIQDRYNASLGTSTLPLALVVLSMTAFGPFIAMLVARLGLRLVMSVGVTLSGAGYLALGFAPSMPTALAACLFLIGPGIALFAALPPAILAAGWFPEAQGRVMGIAYLPLLVTFIPMVGVDMIQRFGLASFFTLLAAMHLALLPLMLGVIEPPAEIMHDHNATAAPADGKARVILLSGIFWFVALGDGILNGTAITGGGHMLPIVTEYGVSQETGAVLLSLSGGASIIGSLLAGYACDRIGPTSTLGLAGTGFALAWALIAISGGMLALTIAAFLIGFCGASVFPPISVLVATVFGIERLPKVLGILGIMTVPFTFAMSPAAGWLRDASENYNPVFGTLIASSLIAAVTFFGMGQHLKRKSANRLPEARSKT